MAALQVLAAIRQADRPASEICHCFEPLPQIVESVPTLKRPSAAVLNRITQTHERRLGSLGRLLVRSSGTENLVRIMAEGDDPAVVRAVVDDISSALRSDLSEKPLAA